VNEHRLQRGDRLPHLEVRTRDGRAFTSTEIWQRRHLVLVVLPGASAARDATALTELAGELERLESVCVVTGDPVPGLPAPGMLVADRWGEIVFVATAATIDGLPSAADLLDWLEHLQQRCPECEGEAR
jgi:hypothetical protein